MELPFLSLKMMLKNGLEFILKLTEPLQRYLLSCQANSAILGRYFCTGQQQLWRGSVNFKINSRPLFTIIFRLKNDNFKTHDFSPHIEKVLAGVSLWMKLIHTEPVLWNLLQKSKLHITYSQMFLDYDYMSTAPIFRILYCVKKRTFCIN